MQYISNLANQEKRCTPARERDKFFGAALAVSLFSPSVFSL